MEKLIFIMNQMQNVIICIKKSVKFIPLLGIFILVQLNGTAQTQKQPYPSEELDVCELKIKFFQLCDVAVERFKIPDDLPLSYTSRDGGQLTPKKIAFYCRSYPVRALAVAYDLTGKEEYLTTIKNWSDRMITFQEKMIPKGAYYMNYGRNPFETAGSWYVADCAEIGMGLLATAVRCKEPLEKQRYIKSVETFANLVLENYVGPNGGINNGLWPTYNGEWWASTAYTGPLFFKLYEETGDKRYLNAGLNTVYWFVNLESLRTSSKDSNFIKYNAPGKENPYPTKPKQSAGGILNQLHIFNAGYPYIFSNDLEIEKLAHKEIIFFEKWCSENLLGKGESSKFEKYGYDVRNADGVFLVGGKFGAIPFQIYCLARNGIFHSDMIKIADKELQRIVSMIFKEKDLLITEFVGFAMVSMAEKISPGSVLRKSEPLHKTIILK